jgi:hypothetical protein
MTGRATDDLEKAFGTINFVDCSARGIFVKALAALPHLDPIRYAGIERRHQ